MQTTTTPASPPAPAGPDPADRPYTTTIWTRLANLVGVVIPFVGLVVAIFLLWGVAFSWTYLAILGGMYAVTALGITVGYHRYFTHRSFDTPRPIVFLLAVFGAMAAQGSVLEWVAVHRRHHQHSDDHDDPHSPHTSGHGLLGVIRGAWHSHMGWLFRRRAPGLSKYIPDLSRDRLIRVVSGLFPVWVLLGLLIPAALGGLITLSWMGVLLGLIWGGLVRIFLIHHVTWSVNSVCHLWGSRPFETHDHSRNNLVMGIIALGEGWHNGHHAFPTSARHGLRWWEIDASYYIIRAMSLVGLASNIRVPARERVIAKRRPRRASRTPEARA